MSGRVLFLVLLFAAACSHPDYQSFRDGTHAGEAEANEVWSVALPYESSPAVSIVAAPDGLWAIDFDKRVLHLARIPWDAGQRRKPVHVSFRRADDLDIVDEDYLLVTERVDQRSSLVTLLDRRDLSARFSGVLAQDNLFAIKNEETVRAGGRIVLLQTSLPFEEPRSLTCHLHVIDPATRRAASYRFEQAHMDGVAELLSACGGICELRLEVAVLEGTDLLFYLGDGGEHRVAYALDLAVPGATLKRISPGGDLGAAAKASPERFVAEEKKEKEDEPAPVTIAGKAYRFGLIETLPGATVAIAREERPEQLSAAARREPEWLSLIGLRGDERIWERPISAATERFIADDESDAVYFADMTRTGITVAGVRAGDGRPLPGFPANFSWTTIGGQRFEVEITGTAIDSQKGLVYLHDVEKNRIVCVRHRFAT